MCEHVGNALQQAVKDTPSKCQPDRERDYNGVGKEHRYRTGEADEYERLDGWSFIFRPRAIAIVACSRSTFLGDSSEDNSG